MRDFSVLSRRDMLRMAGASAAGGMCSQVGSVLEKDQSGTELDRSSHD